MPEITTLFFDVGGVFLTNGWGHESRAKAATHFSYDYDSVERRHQPLFEEFDCGSLSLDEYLDQVIFFEERAFSKEDFIQFMKQQSQPYESSLEVLQRLAGTGRYLLFTINNESFALNQYRIKTFGLDQYFTAFLSSCYLGVIKPNRKIFQKALWITQRKGEECLFIDDREENVTAAQACGIRGIHLKDHHQLSDLLKEEGIKL